MFEDGEDSTHSMSSVCPPYVSVPRTEPGDPMKQPACALHSSALSGFSLLAPCWLHICTRLRPLNAMRVLVKKGIPEQHRSSPLYGVAVGPERPSPPRSHFTSRSLASLCLLQLFILLHQQECISSRSFPFFTRSLFLLAPGRRSFPGTSIVPFHSLGSSITWVTRSVSHPRSSGRVVTRSVSGLMFEF